MKDFCKYFFILIVIISCSKPTAIKEDEIKEGIRSIIYDFYFISSESGNLSWVLKADSLIAKASDTNNVYGIKLNFYSDQEILSSDISSDFGKQVLRTNDLFASGNLIIHSYQEEDNSKWDIYAESLWQKTQQKKINLYSFTLFLFDSTLKKKAEIIGDSGTYFLQTLDLRVQGNLKIITASGGILLTDTLYFHKLQNIFSTDNDITYIEGDNIIKGRGFESDPDMENIKIFNAFSGTVFPDNL